MFNYPILNNEGLIEGILYEVSKIFRDRLVGKDALKKYDEIIGGLAKTHLKYDK